MFSVISKFSFVLLCLLFGFMSGVWCIFFIFAFYFFLNFDLCCYCFLMAKQLNYVLKGV